MSEFAVVSDSTATRGVVLVLMTVQRIDYMFATNELTDKGICLLNFS